MPRPRWLSAVLSVAIALSLILHLGQTVPAHASMETLQVAMSAHGDSPCEAGQHLKAGHCGTVTACALYAPLEVSPQSIIADKAHVLPSADAVEVRWQATPQLQPPQYSISI